MAFIQVTTTTETRHQAEDIARYLVEEKLAACVQIVYDINSTYFWKEKIETANECLCLIKTREALFPEVEAAIKKSILTKHLKSLPYRLSREVPSI